LFPQVSSSRNVNVEVPVLVKHHSLKMSVEGGGVAPLFLNLDTKLKNFGSLTLWPAADWIGDWMAALSVLLFAFAGSCTAMVRAPGPYPIHSID
jgi:hypothetical protein